MLSNMGGVAVVTGASSALGEALVQRLSSKHAMQIACITRSRHRRASTLPPNCCYFTADVRQSSECNAAMREIASTLGGVSLLIHCAGCNINKLFVRCTDEDYDTVMDTNVRGAINMTRAGLRYGDMLLTRPQRSDSLCRPGNDGKDDGSRGRGKSVLYIGSVVGQMGNVGQVLYAASKAALSGMTRSLAQEYGSNDIRFNVIAPGLLSTARIEDTNIRPACASSSSTLLSTYASQTDARTAADDASRNLFRNAEVNDCGIDVPVGMACALTREQLEEWRHRCPLRRLATVEDVVDAIVGVAFARYINGQTIAVDGGMSF